MNTVAGLIDDEEFGMVRLCPLLRGSEVRPVARLVTHGEADDGWIVLVALDGARQAIDDRVMIVLAVGDGLNFV